VLALGIGGTLVTFVLVAVSTHWVTGLGWTLSLIVGAALSPTDPAAVFSVLHGRSGGSLRVATVLEGEAGFNDPVAIALVIALVDAARKGHDPAVGQIAWTMLREGVVGAIVGVVLALALDRLLSSRGPSIPVAPALVVSLGAFLAFGVAGIAHGSGFLAAYLFGLMLGDRLQDARDTVGRLHDQLSSLAEVGMFVLLGVALMTIPLRHSLLDAAVVAALLVLVIRPLVAGPVMGAFGLGRAGSIFGIWGGLKGAVPILLGSLPIARGLAGGERLFALVGLVVVFSLLAQGLTLGRLAQRLGI
jgi:cell volume regulation protein A